MSPRAGEAQATVPTAEPPPAADAAAPSRGIPSLQPHSHAATNMYTVEERGAAYSTDHCIYFKDELGPISPWHDIPLWADRARGLVNMVVEIPRWENAKLEISRSAPLNPIKHEMKNDEISFINNVFPYHGCLWNYGTAPQTWEDPRRLDPNTQAYGDNDPIDVLEIGTRLAASGDVFPVKVLGALALVDEGESDWKLIAIDARDPAAADLHDMADVEAHFPGWLRGTLECFRLTKVPYGMPVNRFAFGGEAKDRQFAYKLIDKVHGYWRALMADEVPQPADISRVNVSVTGSSARVSRAAAAELLAAAPVWASPRPRPHRADMWHFVGDV